MKIAICDDNQYFAKTLSIKIENLISEYNLYNFNFEYYTYTEPQQMFGKHFDIAFLDIEMPKMDGFALGDHLFEINNNIYIFYVTSYSRFAVPSIKHRVYRYILKCDDNELKEGICQLLTDLSSLSSNYRFTYRDKAYSIPYTSILYFESGHNKVSIHTNEKTYETVTSLKALSQELPEIFCRCHSGYIVNITAIKSIESNYIVLKNDTQIPLSRKYKHDIIISFLDY